MPFYYLAHLGQGGYAVAHEIHLSVPAHLEVYGISHQFGREGSNLCVYRLAVWRWCAHNAHISCSHQRELQGARYRCCRHGKGVDVCLQLAQLLFRRYAKLLFLIYYQQSYIVPFHRLGQHTVRAHQYVYAPCLKVFSYLFHLLWRTGSRQVVHPHRQSLQTFAECLVMLEGEHCGRHQHSHLLAIGSSLESCTYSHLRLTKSHVATHQAVHRARLLHIVLHLLCSLYLVRSIFIQE